MRNLSIDGVNTLISDLIDNSFVEEDRQVLACDVVSDSRIKFSLCYHICMSKQAHTFLVPYQDI